MLGRMRGSRLADHLRFVWLEDHCGVCRYRVEQTPWREGIALIGRARFLDLDRNGFRVPLHLIR
jgi:hypothetical protein